VAAARSMEEDQETAIKGSGGRGGGRHSSDSDMSAVQLFVAG